MLIFLKSIIISLAVFMLISCGVDEYYFIHPVSQSSIVPEMNNRAIVRIDTSNAGNSAFRNFIIFYCIYVSDADIPSTISTVSFNAINPVLLSNHNTIRPYIDSETHVGVNLDNLFRGGGRRFRYLELSNANIDIVLGANAIGSTLIFDFASFQNPTMTVSNGGGTATYTLYRSNGSGSFAPQPDRFFVNREALSRNEFINDQFNADVVNRSGIPVWPRFTYAAMYIATIGYDLNSHTNIYSTPSLIHVFRLPDSWD